MNTAKVILIPIDNRPVTYSFPLMVANVAGLEAVVPPKGLIGSLSAPADLDLLSAWIEEVLPKIKPDALLVCLDSVLYGGLASSRRSKQSLDEVMERTKQITNWKKLAGNDVKIFVQSSIMRIPHYNAASAEPDYWQEYGQMLFQWSVLLHQDKLRVPNLDGDIQAIQKQIPEAVRNDFTNCRERNFKINQYLIQLAKSGQIDYLVFSQDDTAEFGLNVWERTQLLTQAKAMEATSVTAYPGTDETILLLMSRYLIAKTGKEPKTGIKFSPSNGNLIKSNFEGQSIGESLSNVVNIVGIKILTDADQEIDFAIIVHTSGDKQGDQIQLTGSPDLHALDTSKAVHNTLTLIEQATVPVILCDVAYSNGADAQLVKALLKRRNLLNKLCAYAGWNTTNNTIGSALALGIADWYAKLNELANNESLKRALFVRFADEWAYQSNVRALLKGQASDQLVNKLMPEFLNQLKEGLEFDPGTIDLKLPWGRTFEIEIALSQATAITGKKH